MCGGAQSVKIYDKRIDCFVQQFLKVNRSKIIECFAEFFNVNANSLLKKVE